MRMSQSAIEMLVSRYEAVLKKCRCLNALGTLAVATAITLGATGQAWANNDVGGADSNITETTTIEAGKTVTIGEGGTFEIANGKTVTVEGSLILANGSNINKAATSNDRIPNGGILQIENGGTVEMSWTPYFGVHSEPGKDDYDPGQKPNPEWLGETLQFFPDLQIVLSGTNSDNVSSLIINNKGNRTEGEGITFITKPTDNGLTKLTDEKYKGSIQIGEHSYLEIPNLTLVCNIRGTEGNQIYDYELNLRNSVLASERLTVKYDYNPTLTVTGDNGIILIPGKKDAGSSLTAGGWKSASQSYDAELLITGGATLQLGDADTYIAAKKPDRFGGTLQGKVIIGTSASSGKMAVEVGTWTVGTTQDNKDETGSGRGTVVINTGSVLTIGDTQTAALILSEGAAKEAGEDWGLLVNNGKVIVGANGTLQVANLEVTNGQIVPALLSNAVALAASEDASSGGTSSNTGNGTTNVYGSGQYYLANGANLTVTNELKITDGSFTADFGKDTVIKAETITMVPTKDNNGKEVNHTYTQASGTLNLFANTNTNDPEQTVFSGSALNISPNSKLILGDESNIGNKYNNSTLVINGELNVGGATPPATDESTGGNGTDTGSGSDSSTTDTSTSVGPAYLHAFNNVKVTDDFTAANAQLVFIPSNLDEPAMTVGGNATITDSTLSVGLPGNADANGKEIVLIKVGEDSKLSLDKLETLSLEETGIDFTQGSTVDITATINYDQATGKLTAKTTGGSAAPEAKALSEGWLGGMAIALQGADLAAGQGMEAALAAAELEDKDNLVGFANVTYSDLRYDTGSHVDTDSTSLIAGVARTKDSKGGKLTTGAFIEYGDGSYDTYNSFPNAASIRGSGENSYVGAGILGRMDYAPKQDGHYYTEASLRLGDLSNEYSNAGLRDASGKIAEYDNHTMYYGAHLGAGFVKNLNDKTQLDMYAKYFYTHQQGDDFTLSTGEALDFSGTDSHRIRLGARVSLSQSANHKLFAGLAWEHEFDGKAEATTNGLPIDSPDMKGSTGIAELGVSFAPTDKLPLSIDLGIQGYIGKREGVTGSVQVNWTF